jgi:hypothetical protein
LQISSCHFGFLEQDDIILEKQKQLLWENNGMNKMTKLKKLTYLTVMLLAALALPACQQSSQTSDFDPAAPSTAIETPAIESATPTSTAAPTYEDIVNPDQTYNYEQMMADAQNLAEQYPDLIQIDSIGQSVEGRELLLIKLGTGPKKLLLLGAHHAREYITATFLMETADEYARACTTDGQYGDYDLAAMFKDVTVYIVPMVNPDGVNLVQNGVDAVKDPEKVKSMRMMKDGYSEWKANINGVDLNRQYPCHWDEKASNTDVPSSEMYKGTAPATEPEVQAVMALCNSTDFVLAASFHSKGEVIYWADSGTEDAIPAGSTIAQSLADVTGYNLMPVSEDPAVYGAGFENWFRQDFERPGFCVELTPSDQSSAPHDDAQFDSIVWKQSKYIGALLMKEAAG